MRVQGKLDLSAEAAELVKSWPPLTDRQRAVVKVLIGGGELAMDEDLSAEERAIRAAEHKRADDLARVERIKRALDGCGYCGAPAMAHVKGQHEHEPLTASQIMSIVSRMT